MIHGLFVSEMGVRKGVHLTAVLCEVVGHGLSDFSDILTDCVGLFVEICVVLTHDFVMLVDSGEEIVEVVIRGGVEVIMMVFEILVTVAVIPWSLGTIAAILASRSSWFSSKIMLIISFGLAMSSCSIV